MKTEINQAYLQQADQALQTARQALVEPAAFYTSTWSLYEQYSASAVRYVKILQQVQTGAIAVSIHTHPRSFFEQAEAIFKKLKDTLPAIQLHIASIVDASKTVADFDNIAANPYSPELCFVKGASTQAYSRCLALKGELTRDINRLIGGLLLIQRDIISINQGFYPGESPLTSVTGAGLFIAHNAARPVSPVTEAALRTLEDDMQDAKIKKPVPPTPLRGPQKRAAANHRINLPNQSKNIPHGRKLF